MSFNFLPVEAIENIFNYANFNFNGSNVSQVDRLSKNIMLNVMRSYVGEIFKNAKEERSFLYEFVRSLENDNLSSYEDYSRIFRAIAEKASSLIETCPKRVLHPLELYTLSTQAEDQALEKIWPKLCHEISRIGGLELNSNLTAPEIRASLNENSTLLTSIVSLDLRNLDLKILPPELMQLTALKELNLASNKLTTLPTEIGTLKSLSKLILSGNPIQQLPISAFGLRNAAPKSLLWLYQLCSVQPFQDKEIKEQYNMFYHGVDDYITPVFNQLWKQLDKSGPVDLEWCKEHVLDDKVALKKSLFLGLQDLLAQHPNRNEIYGMVYRLAGSPQTNDLWWGEHHALDNPEIFLGAYDLVRNRVVEL